VPARQAAATFLRGAIEVLVLALVCLSPWVLGAVEPGAEFCLFAGVALLLLLWAVRLLVEGPFPWQHCPVALGLAGLVLFGLVQLTPLPAPVLRCLSPRAARLGEDLLPATPEVLPFGEGTVASVFPAGSTLSVHPAATRTEVVRLLAVFLLFAVVRYNVTSPAAFRRLALAALVNGFLLAFFALVQFFSSPPKTAYWTIPVPNTLFGPFISRNDFPFYLNMCIGLGLGLLLSRPGRGPRTRDRESPGLALPNPLDLLNHPAALWGSLALALMAGSVVFCLSRGGLLSLAAAVVVWLALRLLRPTRAGRLEVVLPVAAFALLLVAWFGLGPIQARLATLWKGNALEDPRVPLWVDVLPAVKDFPLCGTGYGTFLYVELAYRTRTDSPDEGWTNAHNDYLEALVEGGAVRLLLSVLIIGLVYRLGWRALRRFEGRPTAGLVQGGLFAFTTVVVHSFVDFGLHVQAIAVLATVLAAHLAGLGAADPEPTPRSLSLRWLFAPAGAVLAVALGAVLCVEGWRAARAYSLEVAARAFEGQAEVGQQERRVALLERASRVAPEGVHFHLLAGQAYLDLYQTRLEQLEAREGVRDALGAVLAAGPWPGLPAAGGVLAAVAVRPRVEAGPPFRTRGERGDLARSCLVPGLRHYLEARDLCPLMAKPHVRIGASVEWFQRADPRSVYLRRAKLALPHNAELWYLVGSLELMDHQEEQAWSSWRRSLEVSQQFLHPIVERAGGTLNTRELIDKVLPERAETVVAAADQLYPDADAGRRRPFLERARALLDGRRGPLGPADLHLRAGIEAALGDPAAALTSYQDALRLDPHQTAWRCEYARLLLRQGRLREAQRELRTVLVRQPGQPQARQLLEQVARELAEGG
jgi:O-antigen ligase/tetratricopeptide (TPR) repeat protein